MIRGATLIHGITRALKQDTSISPANNACPGVAEYSVNLTFGCALSGPFDNLFLICFSAPQTLCKGIIAVISASTVLFVFYIISQYWAFVK